MTNTLKGPLMQNPPNNQDGQVTWTSPSNIALIKYWGKRPIQIPENPSISFTLSKAVTTTSVSYRSRVLNEEWVVFKFHGKEEPSFANRIIKFFNSLQNEFTFLKDYQFQINSENSFPHSSGIASSASSMSALALALCEIEKKVLNLKDDNFFLNRVSHIARLGSGSASRSVFPYMAAWGKTELIKNSSDQYAVPFSSYHEIYKSFHDDVLIVSDEKKSVSSTAGHKLMETNIFAPTRYKQAETNLSMLLGALSSGDLEAFGKIVEDEAMTLHALMMCSDPSFILMKPETLSVIEKIRSFRLSSKLPIYFTLDAGPNVHILYPETIIKEAKDFINNELIQFAKNNKVIEDQVGSGPFKL